MAEILTRAEVLQRVIELVKAARIPDLETDLAKLDPSKQEVRIEWKGSIQLVVSFTTPLHACSISPITPLDKMVGYLTGLVREQFEDIVLAPAKSIGEAVAEKMVQYKGGDRVVFGDTVGLDIPGDNVRSVICLREIVARAIDAAVAEADDRAAKLVQESHLTRTPLAAAIRERGKVSNV